MEWKHNKALTEFTAKHSKYKKYEYENEFQIFIDCYINGIEMFKLVLFNDFRHSGAELAKSKDYRELIDFAELINQKSVELEK